MTVSEAKQLIHKEHDTNKGLLLLFRMSFDVEKDRIERLLEALQVIEGHYADKTLIEINLVYKLLSLSDTLKASMSHWKVSRPEGLDKDTCWNIIDGIKRIFSN